jgi:hypothetical protein
VALDRIADPAEPAAQAGKLIDRESHQAPAALRSELKAQRANLASAPPR